MEMDWVNLWELASKLLFLASEDWHTYRLFSFSCMIHVNSCMRDIGNESRYDCSKGKRNRDIQYSKFLVVLQCPFSPSLRTTFLP